MATTPPPPQSTFVDIEELDAPSISTPHWPPHSLRQTPRLIEHSFRGPTLYGMAPPCTTIYAGTQVQMSSPTFTSAAGPTLNWAPDSDNMQLCSSPEITSSLSSVVQQDLPGVLPTPGREIPQHFAVQLQSNWDKILKSINRQEETVRELTKDMKVSSTLQKKQIMELSAKVDSHKHQVTTLLTAAKPQETVEGDQLLKAIKLMISENLQSQESLITSEVRFMVGQLQIEVQQDLKSIKDTFLKSFDEITVQI